MRRKLQLTILTLSTLLACGVWAESLWKKSEKSVGMFSDNRARGIGDIVTIVVQESSSVSAQKSSATDRSSEMQEAILQILGRIPSSGFPTGEWSGSSGFSGGGSLSDTQSAQSQLSVMVVDKLPNGVLAIEGMRQVTMANEINYAVIRGFIRPVDIREDNTILSSRIADAQVEFIADGDLTEAQRKGWLNRLQSFINPL